MNKPIHLISLGAGVQSSTMALMAAHGEIGPRPMKAIFADTMAEPKRVYKWLDWLEKELGNLDLGFPVERVSKGNLAKEITTLKKKVNGDGYYVRSGIPAFTLQPNGDKGIVPRQCTYDFKIRPLDKAARESVPREEYLAWRRKHKAAIGALSRAKKLKEPRPKDAWEECQSDHLVVQWIGISKDEAQRMKPSRNPWCVHRWPLIEAEMRRGDCLTWMKNKGYPEPPRSSCTFCPYHSNAHWRMMRDNYPDEWQEAIQIEKTHQKLKAQTTMTGIPYLHSSRVPLGEAPIDKGTDQMELDGFGDECEGMCGL